MQKNSQIPITSRVKNLEIDKILTFPRSKLRSVRSIVSGLKYETGKNFAVMPKPEGVVVKRLS